MSKRTEQFLVGEQIRLVVELRSGAVEVRAGAPGRAVVTLDSDRADEWDVLHLGDSLAIQPFDRPGSRGKAIRIFVEVPVGSDVEVRSISADVLLLGELGAVRFSSRSGNIRLDSVTRLDVTTVSGDIRAGSVIGDASFTVISGDIDVREVTGRFTASSTSGDIRVAQTGGDIEIGTVSGDATIERADGGGISIRCISGDVTLGLPGGIRVHPDISTLSGRTAMPAPSERSPGDTPRVVRVRLRTVSGNITISRVTT